MLLSSVLPIVQAKLEESLQRPAELIRIETIPQRPAKLVRIAEQPHIAEQRRLPQPKMEE